MGRISIERKLAEGRCQGWGKLYKAWIKTREFNSSGTTTVLKDWYNGRQVHLLSVGELWWYAVLRVKMQSKDVLEQFVLEPAITAYIAKQLGFRATSSANPMTTDFVVLTSDDRIEAYSVKADRKALEDPKQKRNLDIEEAYWALLDVPYHRVFKEDLNETEVLNYLDVMEYYNPKNIRCARGMVKHMIAIGKIEVDMTREIPITELVGELRKMFDLDYLVGRVYVGTYSDELLAVKEE